MNIRMQTRKRKQRCFQNENFVNSNDKTESQGISKNVMNFYLKRIISLKITVKIFFKISASLLV